MNHLIVLDLESQDDWISQGRGSGWPEKKAKFLCSALYSSITGMIHVHDDINLLLGLISNTDQPLTIVAHNAQYEAGVLYSYGFDIESVTWVDTMILAKLYCNDLWSYGLEALSQHYLGESKSDDELGKIAIDLGLVKKHLKNPGQKAKQHMEAIYAVAPEIVHKYVKQDVRLTHKLLNRLCPEGFGNEHGTIGDGYSIECINFHSDLIKCLVLARAEGVRVHIPTAREVKAQLEEKERAAWTEIADLVSHITPDLNINSSQQLALVFDHLGISYPKKPPTDKMKEKGIYSGNPSLTADFLLGVDHPLGQAIVRAKKYEKYVRDFIDPVLELSSGEEYAKVYPDIKIYGASATGRASCANPNLQQIPKRDEDGALVRRMYHPKENHIWTSFDYSSQESRVQVHYGNKIEAQGSDVLVGAYLANPNLDLHMKVASIMFDKPVDELDKDGPERKAAKTINLGLSYGMGVAKLSSSLKVSEYEARKLKDKYNTMTPFLESLNQYCQNLIKHRGYLLTLNGRKLYNEVGGERKALNKLIQGSSADQMWNSLVELYRNGIRFMFPVHDSLEISLVEGDVVTVEWIKEIMEKTTELLVPSVVEYESGKSWGELS